MSVSREVLNDANFKSKIISKLLVLLDCEAVLKLLLSRSLFTLKKKNLEPTRTANKRLEHMKVVFSCFHLNGHTQVLYKKDSKLGTKHYSVYL